jgi:hypothetical protein
MSPHVKKIIQLQNIIIVFMFTFVNQIDSIQ